MASSKIIINDNELEIVPFENLETNLEVEDIQVDNTVYYMVQNEDLTVSFDDYLFQNNGNEIIFDIPQTSEIQIENDIPSLYNG